MTAPPADGPTREALTELIARYAATNGFGAERLALSRELTVMTEELYAAHAELRRVVREVGHDPATIDYMQAALLTRSAMHTSDEAIAAVTTLRAQVAALQTRSDEGHAAHAKSFGALAQISQLTHLQGEVDEYDDVVQAVAALTKDGERMRNWIFAAHHRDGCAQRNGFDCDCGRNALVRASQPPAERKAPRVPTGETPE